jgi:hypothetical protein
LNKLDKERTSERDLEASELFTIRAAFAGRFPSIRVVRGVIERNAGHWRCKPFETEMKVDGPLIWDEMGRSESKAK